MFCTPAVLFGVSPLHSDHPASAAGLELNAATTAIDFGGRLNKRRPSLIRPVNVEGCTDGGWSKLLRLPTAGAVKMRNFVVIGADDPVVVDGRVIGAVGISGAT